MIIKYAKYLISSPDYTKCPIPDKPEYAFIGRSNVGKSSLINMLCNYDKLAKTSSAPGKTQMINHFEIFSSLPVKDEHSVSVKHTHSAQRVAKSTAYKPPVAGDAGSSQWYIVDLPGYGFAKVSQSSRRRWEQMIENYLRKRENLSMVFVLIDARHTPQKIDLEFLEQLKLWKIPFCLVFTKSDKENQRTVSKNVKDFLNAMKKTWQFLPQHFVTSAIKKVGKDKVLAFIDETNNSL